MDNKHIIELVVSKNNTVTKSNRLIEAEYKMSAMEFKVVQTVFSNIQPNSSLHPTFIFPIRQFMDMLGLKGESGYAELEKITLNLFKPIQITMDGETKQLSWFQLVNYNDKKGTITIEVNSFWQEFLYSLEGNFTSYKLFNIAHMSSSYSPRIYELLKSRVNLTNKRVISLKDLRAKVGIQNGQYPLYANFKQRVLLPAQKELKAQSDIYFEFKEIKHGRSVSKIEFTIYRNIDKKPVEPEIIRETDTRIALTLFGIKEEVVKELLAKYDENRLKENITYTRNRIESSDIQNAAAYLITAIERDYAGTTKNTVNKEHEEWEAEMAIKATEIAVEDDKGSWIGYTPEMFEEQILEIIQLKRRYGADEEAIHSELFRNMISFQRGQEQTEGNLVPPGKFSNPSIKQICKDAIQSLYN